MLGVGCARAPSGHVDAEPATPLMKSGRRIALSKAEDCADLRLQLQQGFATGEMGSGVSLHGSNPAQLMSALGQKQTSAHVHGMSALPPKADINGKRWDVR